MVWIPFRSRFDNLFQNGKPLWLKLIGCAFVGMFVVLTSMLRPDPGVPRGFDRNSSTLTLAALIGAAVGFLVGALLSLKDLIERRRVENRRMSPALRRLFASGWKSLLLWAVMVFVGTFLVTMIVVAFQ